MPARTQHLKLWLACFSLFFIAACSQPQTPAAGNGAASDSKEPKSMAPGQLLPEAETWGALFIDGKKIGYQFTKRMHVASDAGQRLRVENTTEIRIRRFGGETVMRVEQTATEKADGSLVDFQTNLTSGGNTQKTSGEVRDGKLFVRQGARPAAEVPMPDGGGSFVAVDHSLERTPLKPGETRTIQQVEPTLGGVMSVSLAAKDWEATELLSGTFRLLRIDGKMTMPGSVSMPLVLWTDRAGHTLKMISSLGDLKQVAYQTSKDVALAPSTGAAFDLGKASTVPVDHNIAAIHEKQRATYRVRLKMDSDGTEFASGGAQTVKKIDARTLEVTVRALRPGTQLAADARGAKPTDADLAANALIENDDAAMIDMANKAAGDSQDAWEIAAKLERHVHEAIDKKNFSSAFDSAATVAKTLAGDCTEHAVLLAALTRAKQLPARVAVGLVYMSGANAFGMHMWTEVWIDDRWIGLDATLGHGGLGPGHLKIAHTNLSGPAAYSSFLPVARLLGQMEIEVVEVE